MFEKPPGNRALNPEATKWWTQYNKIFFGHGQGIAPEPLGNRKRGIEVAQKYGHPDALLTPKGAMRLFKGNWVAVKSSWISALRYEVREGGLYVRLKTGQEYGGDTPITPSQLIALASAPSKGREVNRLWRRLRRGR